MIFISIKLGLALLSGLFWQFHKDLTPSKHLALHAWSSRASTRAVTLKLAS